MGLDEAGKFKWQDCLKAGLRGAVTAGFTHGASASGSWIEVASRASLASIASDGLTAMAFDPESFRWDRTLENASAAFISSAISSGAKSQWGDTLNKAVGEEASNAIMTLGSNAVTSGVTDAISAGKQPFNWGQVMASTAGSVAGSAAGSYFGQKYKSEVDELHAKMRKIDDFVEEKYNEYIGNPLSEFKDRYFVTEATQSAAFAPSSEQQMAALRNQQEKQQNVAEALQDLEASNAGALRKPSVEASQVKKETFNQAIAEAKTDESTGKRAVERENAVKQQAKAKEAIQREADTFGNGIAFSAARSWDPSISLGDPAGRMLRPLMESEVTLAKIRELSQNRAVVNKQGLNHQAQVPTNAQELIEYNNRKEIEGIIGWKGVHRVASSENGEVEYKQPAIAWGDATGRALGNVWSAFKENVIELGLFTKDTWVNPYNRIKTTFTGESFVASQDSQLYQQMYAGQLTTTDYINLIPPFGAVAGVSDHVSGLMYDGLGQSNRTSIVENGIYLTADIATLGFAGYKVRGSFAKDGVPEATSINPELAKRLELYKAWKVESGIDKVTP